MLERLEELAKDAEQMPWEHSPADVPYSARQAFRDGCDPSTILRLVRVARAAKAHIDSSNNDDSAGDTWADLSAALVELEPK
jgi:hypothetical protein